MTPINEELLAEAKEAFSRLGAWGIKPAINVWYDPIRRRCCLLSAISVCRELDAGGQLPEASLPGRPFDQDLFYMDFIISQFPDDGWRCGVIEGWDGHLHMSATMEAKGLLEEYNAGRELGSAARQEILVGGTRDTSND